MCEVLSVQKKSNNKFLHAGRFRESEINFVFCEWELYDGTAPEQKTKSAKNSLDTMSKLFFNPSECNKLHPPPFAREAKKIYLFYLARFSHFIDRLRTSHNV